MKLPNRYGSITKLSGTRRKPYMVRIHGEKKWDPIKEEFYQDRPILGYYATRKDALSALAAYNDNPFNIKDANITFGEIFETWKKANYHKLSDSTTATRDSAYKYCDYISKMRIKDIRVDALQATIDACPHGTGTKKNIKTIMRLVYEYAMQNDIVSKDYSQFVKIEQTETTYERIPFTDDEIKKLWELNTIDAKVLLILIYTGMRVNELLKNKKANVNLEERWIYVPKELAKNKTSIRYVPIHSKILPLVKEFYDRADTYLMTNENGSTIVYNNFVARNLKRLNEQLGMQHKFHDTRHTFISKGHKYRIDELCLKRIVGHEAKGITHSVYTHVTMEELIQELEKIL